MREPSPYFIERNGRSVREAEILVDSQDSWPLKEYIAVVQKHSSVIAALVLGVLILTALIVFTQNPQFTAHSTIMIERQAPQVLDMKELMPEASENDNDYYYTQYEILKSRTLARQVIRKLGLQRTAPIAAEEESKDLVGVAWKLLQSLIALLDLPRQRHNNDSLEVDGIRARAVDNYLKHLTISPETFTRLVKVSFTTSDRALSARIANAHVAAYVQRGLELHAQSNEQAQHFLEAKLVELRDRVEKSEAALNQYRHDRGMVGFAVDDKDKVILQRMIDMEKALTDASTQRIMLEGEVQTIRIGAYEALPEVVENPLIQRLKEQYSEITAQYAAMANQFTPDYPPLAQIGAERQEARARLKREVEKVVSSIKARYLAARAQERELETEVVEQKRRTMMLQDASLRDGILAREVDTNRELYKSVLERMKQIGVAAQVQASNVSVVDEAEAPEFPSSPRKLMLLTSFGSLAFVVGIGAAFFIDHLDDTLRGSADVERYLHLPSIGLVPDFKDLKGLTIAKGHNLGRVFTMNGWANGAANDEDHAKESRSAHETVMSRNPFSPASEAYRAIRAAILLSRAERPPRTILIASSIMGEGKTVTAVNIAIAFALTGLRVLLIDADLRRSRCHEVLNIDNLAGVSEVLTGLRDWHDVIRRTSVNELSIVTAGAVPPNPSELLGSSKMAEFLRSASSEFDQIIIDSAPVLPVTDSLGLSSIVDGVLIVAGSRAPKHIVRTVCERLHQLGARILGVVLNRIEFEPAGYGSSAYRYGYSFYQRDGLDINVGQGSEHTEKHALSRSAH
ncbi:MAG: polysaccharide biosynthesis tyrosine autokinase [Deltaproteobacteria bacterium]|nr:polysaccharide biosynthesis tyrosine autokinase [Deltaproteobacteria bacterium]